MIIETLAKIFSPTVLIKICIVVPIFLFVMNLIKNGLQKYVVKHFSHQTEVITLKFVSAVGYLFLLFIIIDLLGLESLFKTLLGTAGVVGVAIGFASKTSLENIISGVLLLSDKTFKLDDIIVVGDKEGVVESIDALSIKIRTYDNQIVRIPNTKLINSDVINLYPHKQRRCDLFLKVSYDADLVKVEKLLIEIAKRNPHVLPDKEVYVFFKSFADLGYEIKYGVWFKSGNLVPLRNTITQDIAKTFQDNDIEIPTPLLNQCKVT